MVIIRPNEKRDFERVKVDEWLNGKIEEIQERVNENRKYKNQETGEDEVRTVNEVRFKFKLDDYDYAHYSRWMTQSVGKKATLYDKYLKKLTPGLEPNKAVDLDRLKGVRVKIMWEDNEYNGVVYQNVAQIRPLNEGINLECSEELGNQKELDELFENKA